MSCFLSICVCTFNRSSILAHCLGSLKGLDYSSLSYSFEVIVVDNNSSDDTRATVQALVPTFPIKMRYVFESQQGISAARNRAILESQGDYLAFIDDECIVECDWLKVMIDNIIRFRPNIMGGPYIGAFLPGSRPKWFKREYGDAYFLNQNLKKGFQKDFHAFHASGGNMIVHRRVFNELPFDTSVGMAGSTAGYGEEADLQARYLQRHPDEGIFYDSSMVLQHIIRPQRMSLKFRAKELFARQLMWVPPVTKSKVLQTIAKFLFEILMGAGKCVFRSREKYPFWQNYIYERVLPSMMVYVVGLAKLWGRVVPRGKS